MKKTYFCKYLPVEGDIKEGDLISKNEVNRIPSLAQKIFLHKYKKDGFYKVKLFLCSRDIQVGNKYINPIYPDKEQEMTYESFKNKSTWSYNKDNFKVIGEISKDAIWIKEGDEFDADKVKIIGTKGVSQMPVYVEIKCPTCKTFH